MRTLSRGMLLLSCAAAACLSSCFVDVLDLDATYAVLTNSTKPEKDSSVLATSQTELPECRDTIERYRGRHEGGPPPSVFSEQMFQEFLKVCSP